MTLFCCTIVQALFRKVNKTIRTTAESIVVGQLKVLIVNAEYEQYYLADTTRGVCLWLTNIRL